MDHVSGWATEGPLHSSGELARGLAGLALPLRLLLSKESRRSLPDSCSDAAETQPRNAGLRGPRTGAAMQDPAENPVKAAGVLTGAPLCKVLGAPETPGSPPLDTRVPT